MPRQAPCCARRSRYCPANLIAFARHGQPTFCPGFPIGQEQSWIWNEAEDGGQVDLAALRQRLELTQLALQTGAPLSTAEVAQLLGARPGAAVIERGGLVARRVSRNVWKLSRAAEPTERPASGFSEGFRRRL